MADSAALADDVAPRYAELHCLSNFSFQRGASSAHELFERAKRLGYGALAITDECSLAGIVRALEASRETGVKLIVGTEVQLADGPKLVLLAQNQDGYSDICRLITTGRRRSAKGEYQLTRKDAEQLGDGVLALWPAPPLSLHAEKASPRYSPSATAKPFPAGLTTAEDWPGERRFRTGETSRQKEAAHSSRSIVARSAQWPRALPAPSPQPRAPTAEPLEESEHVGTAFPHPAPESCEASECHAAWLIRHFPGRAWLVVELHRGPDDAARLAGLRAFGAGHGLPLVAAGDVHMHVRSRRALQ
ncbi:MAG TPA: PHP domain-containing protein, partial [Dokdonella sp.]